jgi:hypothetical protein
MPSRKDEKGAIPSILKKSPLELGIINYTIQYPLCWEIKSLLIPRGPFFGILDLCDGDFENHRLAVWDQ